MVKPVVALKGVCVLPDMTVQFDINRKKSTAAVQNAMYTDQEVFVVCQRNADTEEPEAVDLYTVGVVVSVKQLVKLGHEGVRVVADGKYRAKIDHVVSYEPYISAEISELAIEPFSNEGTIEDGLFEEGRVQVLKEALLRYADVTPELDEKLLNDAKDEEELLSLMKLIQNDVIISHGKRQEYLELDSWEDKYFYILKHIEDSIEISKIRKVIVEKVKESVDKNQKDYYLKEQMKAIKEELGDEYGAADADEYREKLAKLKAPKEIKDKLLKEIKKLGSYMGNMPEAMMIRNYLDCMFEMPWGKQSKENKDIVHAKEVLEADHYGLKEVKERILDYLAVRSYSDKIDAPVICLEGPPGTGKTSIAKSVAEALNRKYVRVCLGGVSDEAEIRGHRRTYIGAIPGRIAEAIKQAGVMNPLILLDEIDKTGYSHRGDVDSALLEVLDTEQNKAFRDHYLEVPLDLSNVLFMTTANDCYDISWALLDRMEVITLDSYSPCEKLNIAKKYLVKKQMSKNGLKEGQLTISDGAINRIINEYTFESGVRYLEQLIGKICRKAVRQILEKGDSCIKVTAVNLEKFIGNDKVIPKKIEKEPTVGLVNGLVWTRSGGDISYMEAVKMNGSEGIRLTGLIGESMRESSQIAYTYIKSIISRFDWDPSVLENKEIHIHVPSGAVKKDGPSAGVTFATLLFSCIYDLKVKQNVAMTGEITLRGKVCAIGGLKEKLTGAKNAGVTEVVVPDENRDDIKEIPKEVIEGLKIHYAKTIDDVFDHVFLDDEIEELFKCEEEKRERKKAENEQSSESKDAEKGEQPAEAKSEVENEQPSEASDEEKINEEQEEKAEEE